MALKGVKVVELVGLAPGPLCGLILAEFGADVLTVDKIAPSPYGAGVLGQGKKSVALDLKRPEGVKIFRELCRRADVLIEPFRPGVMEKLGLGPDVLSADNPGLIYARLTGYGQDGPLSDRAGHDINYVAVSGILSLLKRGGGKPTPPVNLAADFAGGSLVCALGIVMCLYERKSSKKGQVIDCSMVEGLAYLASWILRIDDSLRDLLNSNAHFYNVYRTRDDKFVAVGAIEPQFYAKLLEGLNVDTVDQYGDFERNGEILRDVFSRKTRDEWCEIFGKSDACVTPVLDLTEVARHPHNLARNTFSNLPDGTLIANPAPKLARTPGHSLAHSPLPRHGEHTRVVLSSLGYADDRIQKLQADGVVGVYNKSHV